MNRFILFSLQLLVLSSCIDVIDMDLQTKGTEYVIDGSITNSPEHNEVKITTTVDVNDRNEFPPVSGAEVTVADLTTGEDEMMAETFPGVYSIQSIYGVPGHIYLLSVSIEGQRFEAVSTMPEPVSFDSIGYIRTGSPHGENIRITASFSDPETPGNNYRFVTFQNGIQSQSIFVRNDAYTNGNDVVQALFNPNIKIVDNDLIEIEMQCVDQSVYQYFNGLMLLQSDRGVTPTNPVSNISGGALGYFSAHTVERRSIRIE